MPTSRYHWLVALSGMLIASVTVPCMVSLFSLYILDVTADLGISRSAFTLSNAIIQGLGIVVSAPASRLLGAGRFRLWMGLSVALFAVAYASYGLAQSVWHLLLSSFFIGLFYLPASLLPLSIVITNWFDAWRGFAMSLVMAGIGLGGFVFSPVISFFLEQFGWRISYGLMALVVVLVCLPLTLFVLRSSPAEKGLKPYGKGGHRTATEQGKPQRFPSVEGVWRRPFFRLLMLGMVGCGLVNGGVLGQFPPALEEMMPGGAARIVSTYAFMSIAGNILLGWLTDRFGAAVAAICGCLAFTAALFLMLCASGGGLFVMAVVLGPGLAIGTVLPPLLSAVLFGQKQYSRAYGLINGAAQAGLTLGSLCAAGLYDLTGAYTAAWLVLMVLCLIILCCWLGALRLARTEAVVRQV